MKSRSNMHVYRMLTIKLRKPRRFETPQNAKSRVPPLFVFPPVTVRYGTTRRRIRKRTTGTWKVKDDEDEKGALRQKQVEGW